MQNQAGSIVVSSPSSLKDDKFNLLAAEDSKLLVQPSSDNKQKAPIMASSSSSFHTQAYRTFFHRLLSKKTPDYNGMFADKKNTSSDSSKPAFQFGGNNVIFGGKKDAPVDSSKPFQFGPNNGIFGDKKDTPSDSNKPFHFGANKGIFGDKKTTSGDSSNPF
ncbi:hypothetical protein ZEAMMB73_Zm00001d019017 [Zea mays]|uniref:Uncharacterized protein n=1 Tax=Zea mays TaxID=4577 RepID=A0A1D6HUC6_MAIZE|nr:hypothetical protein ZEAMMB73_Zm00001d019017 [Zea mays]